MNELPPQYDRRGTGPGYASTAPNGSASRICVGLALLHSCRAPRSGGRSAREGRPAAKAAAAGGGVRRASTEVLTISLKRQRTTFVKRRRSKHWAVSTLPRYLAVTHLSENRAPRAATVCFKTSLFTFSFRALLHADVLLIKLMIPTSWLITACKKQSWLYHSLKVVVLSSENDLSVGFIRVRYDRLFSQGTRNNGEGRNALLYFRKMWCYDTKCYFPQHPVAE